MVFAEGDKNGKLLSMLVADYHPIANILVSRNRGGALVTDTLLIMQEFVDFFSSLYSSIPNYDESALDSLLEGLPLPKLSGGRQHKATGPGGFPADFCKSKRGTLGCQT